ncbi:restriction endonuclease subunit S [Flavobacterium sp. LHD-80]|uniref:restriction endonuclease subunit S n=1 Tax=Flavobacterium sp. LHD-80 TaxID=3071411 RepID=UPI0027E07040|nr:restriction endonuclease subunit S [Flavobacterium sp. LHD-80]MDQ6471410.1 restriction endonuclease subunit S [Flavobacterium sp. LHD-80]
MDKTIYKLFNGNLLEDNNRNDKLPKLWKWKTLNQIGEIYSGGTPSTEVQEFWGEEICWITPSDLTNYKGKYISKGKKSISMKGLQNSSAKLLPPNSVLFSSRAPIGYVVISSNKLSTNQGFKNIIPNADVNPSFLYYFLKSIKNYANKIASGTTFLELSTEKFKQIPFPLPPIDEQNIIVEEIDNAVAYSDNLIEELLSQRRKSEHIKEKLLQDAFLGKLSSQLNSDSSVGTSLKKINLEKNIYLQNQRQVTKIRTVREKKKLVDVLKSNFKKTHFSFDDIIKTNSMSIDEMEVEFKILIEKEIVVKQYDNISKSIRFKLI